MTCAGVRSLKLAWRPFSRRLIVGTLTRSREFAYDGEDIKEAIEMGFTGYTGFDLYRPPPGETAFHMFAARTPPLSRPDRAALMHPWGLSQDESDAFLVLAATGGRLPTDRFEFVPVLEPRPTRVYMEVDEFTGGVEPGARLSVAPEEGCLLLRSGDRVVGRLDKVIARSVERARRRGLYVGCLMCRPGVVMLWMGKKR